MSSYASLWIQLGTAVFTQITCLVITYVIRLPYVSSNGMLLSFFNCFGGGVLLSIALIHMLPEMQEQFEHFNETNSYPIGMFFIMLGYFALLILEKVLFRHEHHHVLKNESQPLFVDDPDHPFTIESTEPVDVQIHVEEDQIVDLEGHESDHENHVHGKKHKKSKKHDHGHGHGEVGLESGDIDDEQEELSSFREKKEKNTNLVHEHGHGHRHGHARSHEHGHARSHENGHSHENEHSHGHSHGHGSCPSEKLVHGHRLPFEAEGSLITPILLFLVLSVHAIFEGIVLGLQGQTSQTFSIAIAIVFHKPVEALTLGIVMCVENISKANYFLISVFFSCVTSVGILIGVAIKSTSSVPPFLVGVFTALAIGSFLYISTTEIIADEFHRTTSNKEKALKTFAVFLGMAFICISEIWLGAHSHDHGHDHPHPHPHSSTA